MVAYSFKERFINPIKLVLGQQVTHEPGGAHVYAPKLQTIRAIGKRRHARPGEVLQLYYGMRTKHCYSIGVASCTAISPVRIVVREKFLTVYVDDKHVNAVSLNEFAKADGFSCASDMFEFWKKEHGIGVFLGVLIRWEPIRG